MTVCLCGSSGGEKKKDDGEEIRPERQTDRQTGITSEEGVTYRRPMTKTAMKMTSRTTLPITETRRTVEFVPSPIIGEGTVGRSTDQSSYHSLKRCLLVHCL